jgi:hypothetical protein
VRVLSDVLTDTQPMLSGSMGFDTGKLSVAMASFPLSGRLQEERQQSMTALAESELILNDHEGAGVIPSRYAGPAIPISVGPTLPTRQSRAQRRSLMIPDRMCRYPGCHQPDTWKHITCDPGRTVEPPTSTT